VKRPHLAFSAATAFVAFWILACASKPPPYIPPPPEKWYEINSTPAGATVKVDGAVVGNTPTRFNRLGNASLSVEKSGYETATTALSEQAAPVLHFNLEKLAPNTFTRSVVERMSAINQRPAIFALSNPTSRAECTPEQAYAWSGGRAIFASGSPFAPVTYGERTFRPAQGNNAYVFPGIGLGAIACRARTLPDELFLAAAGTLAGLVQKSDLDAGALYPPLAAIRKISLAIAVSVAKKAFAMHLTRAKPPVNVQRSIEARMYQP